jgi:glutamyl-tRNA synthetase
MSVTEYLINLVNSDFQEWRTQNPLVPCTSFNISFENMSKSGALFDILKLNDISKNVIATMDADLVYDLYLSWAKVYNTTIATKLIENEDYSKKIFNIERVNEKPRKDFVKWLDVAEHIEFFFDDFYKNSIKDGYNFPDHITIEDVNSVLTSYIDVYDYSHDNDTWFATLKELSVKLGYAKNAKTFKKNPELYKGILSDVATIVRVALTNKVQTQDLHEVMQVMGEARVIERLSQKFI